MRKKALVLTTAIGLAMVAMGCGKSPEVEPTDAPASEATTAADTSSNDEDTTAAPAVDGNTLTTMYYSVTIPDGYTDNEDDARDKEGYVYHSYEKLDSEDNVVSSVKVTIEEKSTMSYNKTLIGADFDLHDYADNKYEKKNIGGVDFLNYQTTSWGEEVNVYLGRDTSNGYCITVKISGEANSDTDAIVNSLQFNIPAGDFVEAPFPWEGAPLQTTTGTVEGGGYTFETTQYMLSDSFLVDDIFDNRVVVDGDLAYVLSEDELHIYNVTDTAFELKEEIELGNDYGQMCIDDNGNVYISDFMRDTLIYKDGALSSTNSFQGKLYMAPDASFGLSFFLKPDEIKKVTLAADGTFTEELFNISNAADLGNVTEIGISDDHVFLCANDGDNHHKVYVYDYSGNLKMELVDDDGSSLGSITYVLESDNGIIGIDGNMRELLVWDKNGNVICKLDDGDTFGTHYPWISGLCATDDGYFVSLTEERSDKSWDELAVYKIKTDF